MPKRRKEKTIGDVPWPPLDWEPPPLREDELTALEGASQDAEREVQIRTRPAPMTLGNIVR